MKISVFLLFLSVFTLFAGTTNSQNAKVNLTQSKLSVGEFIEEVEKQTDYLFVYSKNEVETNRSVSIRTGSKSVGVYLNEVFNDTDITYFFENDYIVLTKNSIPSVQQQKIIVSGVITDNYGDPVIGANVIEAGTTNGTITDRDGNFTLSVSSLQSSLFVTYIGYEQQTFALRGDNKVSITLKEDLLNLDEVVVVGYGTARKRDVTGAVASVKGDKIKERATFNAAQALQGQASGVAIVQTNARPGEDPQIRIRGTRSLKGGNDPLFVVDGIPITTALGEISPSDIESMEILKDASATAIYGSRGANGVILITTKKGKAGKTQIDYNGYYGIQHAARRIKMMDGNEYIEMVREANRNSSSTTPYPFEPNIDADRRIGYLSNDPRVWSKIEKAYDENGVWHPEWLEYTDWTGESLRNAAIQNHEVSVRGGTDKMRILGSATYFKQDGVVRGQDYERYSVRVNFDWDITDRITVGGQTQFSHVQRNLGTNVYNEVRLVNPLADIYDEDGNHVEDRPGNDPARWNYFLNLEHAQNLRMNDRFLGSYYVDIKLPFDLNFRSNVGIDIRHHEAPEFYGSMSSDRQGAQARAINKKEARRLYTWENLLFYNKTFNKDHTLGVTFLQSIQQQTTDHVEVKVEDLPYENQWWYNVGSAETITGVGSNYERWRLASFMGRVNYNFKDRYLLTVSARYDGSSRLAPGNKWVLFPSAALAWRINEEAFLKNVDVLSNLKLRLGYGITGNTAIDPYKTQGSLSYGRYIFDSTGVMAFRQNEMPNPYLTWEKTEQWNLGLDFGFFNGRLSGVIDMYLQNTNDLLMERQLPVISGFENVLSNVGKTRNKGIEITLNTLNIDNKNFTWSTDFIFARNKEEIVELYNGKEDDEGNNWFIGNPLNVFYNYKADGIWQLEDAEELADPEKWDGAFKPGDIKIVDRNGDYKITAEDRFILGQKDPKYTISMTNNFRYKDFDLSIFLNAGLSFMKEYNAEWALNGRYGGASINYWRIIGYDDNGNPISNGSNEAPRPSIDQESPNYIQSLYRVDASFLRIGQITLGYTIPSHLTRKLGIQSLRLYGSVQNAYVFTGFKGTDPESGTNFNAPMPRTSMIGINLSF